MINDIINVIKKSQHVLLSAHQNPDGDAIGSLVGMANVCKYFNIDYTVLLEHVPNEYAFLINNINSAQAFDREFDTFICLDCGAVDRLGNFKNYFQIAKNTINIDHHETNVSFGHYNYVEKDASSTAELVFNIIQEADIPLIKDICEAIYTGIITDTGGFMHSCTKPSTHIAVSKLLEVPFDFTNVYYQMIHQKTEKTILLQGVAANNIIKLCDGKVFLSTMEAKDLEKYDATRDDASSIVSYIKNIKGCEVAIFIYPGNEDQTYKISFRSNPPYDVAEIAAVFGGGGHIRAAGATIRGTLSEVMTQIKKALNAID